METYAASAVSLDASTPPHVIAPDPARLFAERARRFEELADGHPLGDWLRFLGRLSDAQHIALRDLPAIPLPPAMAIERARRHAMPPAPAQEWRQQALWREALYSIIATLDPDAPAAVRKTLTLLGATVPAQLDALAQRVLRQDFPAKDADLVPFIAAALQVAWTATAARLAGIGMVQALDAGGVCPCCGSLPVASVVRSAGEVNNLRYLHCSLCNTEWNMVRVRCAACASTGRISYSEIAGPDTGAAVRAETCEECKSYLKIFYREKAPHIDPVADDLATLALDVLVDADGYARAGPNLLFVPGPG